LVRSTIDTAVIWDDQGKVHSVGADLEAAGIDLKGYRLATAHVTVGLGHVVLYGSAEDAEGRRAWVAWLP
jgi:hypothetical protein